MGLFEGGGGLLTVCSSRVGAYSRGGVQFEDLRYMLSIQNARHLEIFQYLV